MRVLWLAPVVLATGCNLPPRNNPNDPTKSPIASIVSRVCVTTPAPGNVATCPPGLEGTRRTLFQFDASGSHDPFSDDALHYAWDLDGTGTFAIDTGTVS